MNGTARGREKERELKERSQSYLLVTKQKSQKSCSVLLYKPKVSLFLTKFEKRKKRQEKEKIPQYDRKCIYILQVFEQTMLMY